MAGATPVQTQEDIVPPPPTAIGYRLAGVLLAAPVAVAMQVVLEGPFGLDLMVPEGPGSSSLEPLSLLSTAWVTLVLSLAAWLGIVLLQKGMGEERGRKVWMTAAFAFLAVSFAPVAALDISTGAQWGLVALHSVVALVVIPTMAARGTPGDVPTTNSPNPPTAGHDAHGHDAHGHDDHGHGAHEDVVAGAGGH